MTQIPRLGVPPDLFCAPLVRPLQRDERFRLVTDAMGANGVRLRERELEAALIGMIDYARDSSEYRILSGPVVAGGSDAVVLHFREGLHTIRTLAVHPAHTAEIVLARILLAEEFDAEPALVPAEQDLASMLRKADAALLVGDPAFRESARHPNRLDLADLWRDLTGLPFTHAVWCTRENALTAEHAGSIVRAARQGAAAREEAAPDPESQIHLDGFLYAWDEEIRAGVAEFLRYAYYHGVIPDVPELNILGAETGDGDSPGAPDAV